MNHRRMGGREGEKSGWLSGRALHCISILRKFGKGDGESLNRICPSEKSNGSQEWPALVSLSCSVTGHGKCDFSTKAVVNFRAWQLGQRPE